MSFTPGNRPADVTVNPETGAIKDEKPFPGSRYDATLDPQRDGDPSARKTTALPFGLPFGTDITPDPARDGDVAQSDNASFDDEHGESGSNVQGAVDPEH